MHEFALIDHIRARFSSQSSDVLLGIGDDCALLRAGEKNWAISTDTFVENTHFFAGTAARAIGHKALAVNLSDLAAMGAKPLFFLLNLTLPDSNPDFDNELISGIHDLAQAHQCTLIGGDTTRGPLSISITVFGECLQHQALKRSGAQVHDLIFVSGSLGGAAYAVQARQRKQQATAATDRALDWPEPRIALGLGLRGIASAAIDLSDGLVNDLGHICRQSQVSARLEARAIPIASDVLDLQFAVNGGDDYELCFCVPPNAREAVQALSKSLNIDLHEVGVIEASTSGINEVSLWQGPNKLSVAKGFQHFPSKELI
jgi:thiamine-monophosphate kinase